MKKTISFLFLLLGLASVSHAAKIAVTVSDGSLQPGTTAGFNVSSGTAQTFNFITLTSTNGVIGSSVALQGTTTNNEASSLYVGAWSTGTFGGLDSGAYVNSAVSNAYTAFSTITIPSGGDWLVCGTIQSSLNGATMTRNRMALSVFSGNTTSDQLTGKNDVDITVPTAASNVGQQLCYRFEFTAASTVYLKSAATFSAGQPQYLGFGWATRRR